MRYLVSYDLMREKDSPRLIEELERLGAVRVLFSMWVVTRDNTDTERFARYLRQFMDSDDRLLVLEFPKSTSWFSFQLPLNLNHV